MNQKNYSDIVNIDNLKQLLKNTEFENFTIHCYYYRYVFDSNLNRIRIRILRIKCNGKTHAVLLDSMIPYLSYSYEDVFHLVFNASSAPSILFSDYVVRYIRKAVSSFLDNFSYGSLCSFFAHSNPISFITT